MTVNSKLQRILKEIVAFEDWVGNIDSELGLKKYYIHMPSLVIPYSIEVRHCSDDTAIAVFDIHYDDIIMSIRFTNALQDEIERVNALNDLSALDELNKIKVIFGF
jgi:hypothetical protein